MENKKSKKCEFCEQKFNEDVLTKTFNTFYNHLCVKCVDYINLRKNDSEFCSQHCLHTGKCDSSCSK